MRKVGWSVGIFALLCAWPNSGSAQGLVIPGAGPINRSMGGASTAAPIDSLGALLWNPATISALDNRADIATEIVIPRANVTSFVPANAFGPGVPATNLFGKTRSDSGVGVLPNIGVVFRATDDSPITYGIGLLGISGTLVNFPSTPSNPIISPPPPKGFGLGGLYVGLFVQQLAPTVSFQLTDRLSVGLGPTIDFAVLQASAGIFDAPDLVGPQGFARYAPAVAARMRTGFGAQLGLYYTTDVGLNFGGSVKSPQWFETFTWNSTTPLGEYRRLAFHFGYPMIVSLGWSYTGIDRLTLANDFRIILYDTTQQVGNPAGFTPDGAVNGFGYHNVFAVSTGAQYKLTDRLALRAGYSFGQNPIADRAAYFNFGDPLITEHILGTGLTYDVSQALSISLAYIHGFSNRIQGPIFGSQGAIAGTSAAVGVQYDSLAAGVSVKF